MGAFQPHHIAAVPGDFEGNGGAGRHVLLPGSPGRAAAIATRFDGHRHKPHPRGHDLHLGTVPGPGGPIDVAAVATGMGGSSVEIIVTELLALGARRLLRVGTAGSLQARVKVGELVVATAAVRDDGAGADYLPPEFPAVASQSTIERLRAAADRTGQSERVHYGCVHSKDTLYAREFLHGPRAEAHGRYKSLLRAGGVLASEMECATLFVLGAVAHQQGQLSSPPHAIEVGAVLAIIGGGDEGFAGGDVGPRTVDLAIELALASCQ